MDWPDRVDPKWQNYYTEQLVKARQMLVESNIRMAADWQQQQVMRAQAVENERRMMFVRYQLELQRQAMMYGGLPPAQMGMPSMLHMGMAGMGAAGIGPDGSINGNYYQQGAQGVMSQGVSTGASAAGGAGLADQASVIGPATPCPSTEPPATSVSQMNFNDVLQAEFISGYSIFLSELDTTVEFKDEYSKKVMIEFLGE